jgi:hypothetical protein
MPTIQEIVANAAMAAKQKTNTLTAAEHLRKAADLLEKEATAPKKFSFKEIIQDGKSTKEERMQKFNANIKAGFEKELVDNITRHGWRIGSHDTKNNIRSFGNPKHAGFRLIVKGSSFVVKYGEDTRMDEHIRNIDLFLEKQANFLIINK